MATMALIYLVILVLLILWANLKFNFFTHKYLQKLNQIFLLIKGKIIPEYSIGKKLLFAISKIESSLSIGILGGSFDLPEYKFYSDIILQLILDAKRKGIRLAKHLEHIKAQVLIDFKFEKKVHEEILSGIIQFLIVSLVTWIFILFSQKLIEINVSKAILISVFLLQLFGIILYLYSSKIIKYKVFSPFSLVFKELYLFKAAIEVGIPLNLAGIDSNIFFGEFSKHSYFKNEYIFFSESIARLKELGKSPAEDCELILRSILINQEEKFTQFSKSLTFLKFLHLALIFLPAYFLYLFSIFKFFMEQ